MSTAAVSVNGSSVQRLSCVNVGISRYMCMVQWSTTVTKWGLLSCGINVETSSQISSLSGTLHWCNCVRNNALYTSNNPEILFVKYVYCIYVYSD